MAIRKIVVKVPEEHSSKNTINEQDRECPFCKTHAHIATIKTEEKGFLRIKTKKTRTYTCVNCRCQWKVEGEWRWSI